jgi:hypothetical protein
MYPYEVRKVNIVCYATRMKLTQTEGNNVSLVRLWLITITITIICSVLGGGVVVVGTFCVHMAIMSWMMMVSVCGF